jgi:nicotinate-nucleotide adenylyltransferase
VNLNNKIIVYGGSFNPPGLHHLNIIKYLLDLKPYKVFIIPTDDNYEKDILAPLDLRIEMMGIMIRDLNNVEILKYVREDKDSVKTIDYLDDIKRKFKKDVYFALGEDNLEHLDTWANFQKLVRDYHFIVFRKEKDPITIIASNKLLLKHKDRFILCNKEKDVISSTIIRDKLFKKDYLDIQKYLTGDVFDYIVERGLYKNGKENI